ncbi:MAG: Intracellular proteinase inhibitor [Frankiales bacterium]|nr:Intracellular proteinase inhibitor [Frankiales bacterium]
MPDPELLPPGRSIDAAVPSPDGIGGVTKRATERRRVKAASVGATAAASVAAVFAVIASGGANDALNTINPPAGKPPVTSTASGAPSAPSVPGPGVAIPPVESLVPQATLPPSIVPSTKASPRATSSPSDPTQEGEVGPPYTVTNYDASRKCDGDGPTPAQGWCSYYDGALSGKGGSTVQLAAAVCRITGQVSGTYSIDSGDQAEFSAYDAAGNQQWLWSKGHHFSTAGSELVVPAGKCIRWAVSWDVSNQAGHPLSPGTYELFARPQGEVSGGTSVTSNAGTLTFTVT